MLKVSEACRKILLKKKIKAWRRKVSTGKVQETPTGLILVDSSGACLDLSLDLMSGAWTRRTGQSLMTRTGKDSLGQPLNWVTKVSYLKIP